MSREVSREGLGALGMGIAAGKNGKIVCTPCQAETRLSATAEAVMSTAIAAKAATRKPQHRHEGALPEAPPSRPGLGCRTT
jgi:hypothetical protein